MSVILLLVGLAAVAAIGWPAIDSAVRGGPNEATRLVHAAERAQTKARSLSDSYNDVIPSDPERAPDTGGEPSEPTLTPSEHAVRDAMNLLSQAQQELDPSSTEYLNAVNLLKAAWGPRYARAVDEFRRFKQQVEYARDVSGDYLAVQERLTDNINDPVVRERLRQIDGQERELIAAWLVQAAEVLAHAEAVKIDLDDMNIRITKLELSATFASAYEGIHEVPLALTTLNAELAQFDQETARIYQVFSPKVAQ